MVPTFRKNYLSLQVNSNTEVHKTVLQFGAVKCITEQSCCHSENEI